MWTALIIQRCKFLKKKWHDMTHNIFTQVCIHNTIHIDLITIRTDKMTIYILCQQPWHCCCQNVHLHNTQGKVTFNICFLLLYFISSTFSMYKYNYYALFLLACRSILAYLVSYRPFRSKKLSFNIVMR